MNWSLTVLRLLSLAAFAASAAAALDHWSPLPYFCAPLSDCGTIAASAWGRPLGVPLPFMGLATFAGFLALSFAPAPVARRWLPLAALVIALGGGGLFVVQAFVLKLFCRTCLVVDTLALLLGIVALARPWRDDEPWPKSRKAWWGALALAAAFAPWAWQRWGPPPPWPPEVAALQAAGRLTLVEVTDFDCPACRAAHPTLRAFLKERPDAAFVRRVFPMPQHAHARNAARAYFAAANQGQGEAMADALFAAADLSPAGCRKLAATLGLDLASFDASVADPTTDRAIDADAAWAPLGPRRGLPMFWLGRQFHTGPPTLGGLRAAAARESDQRP